MSERVPESHILTEHLWFAGAILGAFTPVSLFDPHSSIRQVAYLFCVNESRTLVQVRGAVTGSGDVSEYLPGTQVCLLSVQGFFHLLGSFCRYRK